MKKNYFRIVCNLWFVACLGLVLVGCEGEDGANGLNGVAGVDGTNGTNGENGVGFDALTQFGTVSLKVTGTRSDNVTFVYENDLKFTHNEKFGNDFTNNDPDYYFNVIRFPYTPDSHEDNALTLNLTVNNAGLETQTFDLYVRMNDYSILSDDLKYFVFDQSYTNTSTGVSNFSLTDYSYSPSSGELKYSFSIDIAGANNSTGNDMTISGTVDVKVVENDGGGLPPRK